MILIFLIQYNSIKYMISINHIFEYQLRNYMVKCVCGPSKCLIFHFLFLKKTVKE